MLFLALYHVCKTMEPLSFNSPVETDVVERFPTAAKVMRERIGENEKVVREVIIDALKNMKGGKAAGMDSIVVKMLKNGGVSIIDWLLRIFNGCIESGDVP